ncbi:MAG: hypothetical protein PHV37_10325 [Candidatus Gastranaerophilales bacterium]|nr:hypothetical protein [Candidatus Gastranaerophilales bacterium]
MWRDLLLKLVQNGKLDTSKVNEDDLKKLQDSQTKEQEGIAGESIFAQGVSFDIANSMKYFVEEDEDGMKEITTDVKDADMTDEQKSVVQLVQELLNVKEVQKAADANNDGKIDNDEIQTMLKNISAFDTDSGNISSDDVEKLFQDLDVNLSDLISNVAKSLDPETETETEGKLEDIEDPAEQERGETYSPKTSNASTPSSSYQCAPSGGVGGTGGTGSSSGSNGAGNTSATNPSSETADARTPDEIKKEIETKETEKETVNTDTEEKIQAEQEKYDEAVQKAMEEEKVDEKVQQEYDKKSEELAKEISTQDKNIQDAEGKIQDATATIEAKTTAISDVEGQIGNLQSSMSSVDEKAEDAASKKADIQGKIDNLTKEKETLEADKKKAEEDKTKAEEAKTKAQEAKTKAQEEKDKLLETLAKDHPEMKDKLDKVAEKTKELKAETDEKIKSLESEKKTKVDGLDKEIQTLKTELAQAEQKEKTDKVIAENRTGPVFDFEENLSDSQKADLEKFKKLYTDNKDKYEKVAEATGVPAELVAAIHWRESSGNFNTYLHNGDPLGKPTTHVPAGKNFNDWTEAAIDAINSQDKGSLANNSDDLDAIADYAERYNGLGYRNKGVASPYVWAGTTNYSGGKYVADGVYDSSAYDQQLGVMVMLKSIME